MTPLSRRSLIFRRTVLAVTVVCLLPLAYSSAFIFAGFLFGAGVIPMEVYRALHDTSFLPIYWVDGDSDRLEFLFGMVGNAYRFGVEFRR